MAHHIPVEHCAKLVEAASCNSNSAETADVYMAHSIELFKTRLDGMEQRMDALQTMHENTLIIVGLGLTLFGIIIAIAGIASTFIIWRLGQRKEEIRNDTLEDLFDSPKKQQDSEVGG